MKIKFAILEKDQSYLNRIVSIFTNNFSESLEIYSFTDKNIAIETINNKKIDVFFVSEKYNVDLSLIPKRCGFAYFVESNNIETFKNQKAVCKYQKSELIYKQILSIYSENAQNISKLKFGDEKSKIIIFSSVAGGDGASCVAASVAKRFAAKNKKTLYLNIEKLGSSDIFFSGQGSYDMSDIIFALKSTNINLQLKLESCAKQDESGVYFYSQSKVALDIEELSIDDVMKLITELQLIGSYDYIIIDMDFTLNHKIVKILQKAHYIIWVCSGGEISNLKLKRAYQAFSILDSEKDISIMNKLAIIYNKFSNKTCRVLDDLNIINIGGIPKYEYVQIQQILQQISSMDMIDKIM